MQEFRITINDTQSSEAAKKRIYTIIVPFKTEEADQYYPQSAYPAPYNFETLMKQVPAGKLIAMERLKAGPKQSV